jgi:uncharacterized membrane protein
MGVLRMILIIIGVIVVLRFIGQLMIAKRNIDEQNRGKAERDQLEKQRKHVEKNKGKTTLVGKTAKSSEPFEDVDYEEVKN